MRWLPFMLLFLLFSSCADLEKQGFLDRIETMEGELDTMLDAWNTERIENVQTLTDDGNALIAQIKTLESDTIPLEFAEKIDRFMRLFEKLPIVLKMEKTVHEEVKQMLADLQKLKQDISQGNGKRHKYESYVKKEESKLNVLSQHFERYTAVRDEVKNELPEAIETLKMAVLNE